MPCPFTGPKKFWAGQNVLSQPKNLTAFSASSKTFVLAQKAILLNANHHTGWCPFFGVISDPSSPLKSDIFNGRSLI